MMSCVVTIVLGSQPKKGLAKVGWEWCQLGVTFHVPESVRGCEGMNPHTPNWVPTLGVGVPMDFQIFKKNF
jgi:hypothetical protein